MPLLILVADNLAPHSRGRSSWAVWGNALEREIKQKPKSVGTFRNHFSSSMSKNRQHHLLTLNTYAVGEQYNEKPNFASKNVAGLKNNIQAQLQWPQPSAGYIVQATKSNLNEF